MLEVWRASQDDVNNVSDDANIYVGASDDASDANDDVNNYVGTNNMQVTMLVETMMQMTMLVQAMMQTTTDGGVHDYCTIYGHDVDHCFTFHPKLW